MTAAEFTSLATAHRLRGAYTISGCRLVLVDGLGVREAGRRLGVNPSALSRALAKLRVPLCPTCGAPTK